MATIDKEEIAALRQHKVVICRADKRSVRHGKGSADYALMSFVKSLCVSYRLPAISAGRCRAR